MVETLLIIDDNASQLKLKLSALQHKMHYHVLTAAGNEASVMQSLLVRPSLPSAILLDLDTVGEPSFRLIPAIKNHIPGVPIIVFTAYGDNEGVNRALGAGAYDFVTKPVTMERLQLTIQHALRLFRTSRYVVWLERKVAGHVDLSDIIGDSNAIKATLAAARQAASSRTPLWIYGEEGTGRELLARAIHGSSDRVGKPFIVVNCEMLPRGRAEAILFGQDKGVAPGHTHFVLGKLREADQGTLLLKHVEALDTELQQRLVQLLDSGLIMPLGSTSPLKVDVRLMCSARPSAEGYHALNPQLMSRLKRMSIATPALKERTGDIPLLARHFLVMYAASENKYIHDISDAALQWLEQAPWQGNVAQLSTLIWRAVMLCDQEILEAVTLQQVHKIRPAALSDGNTARFGSGASLLDDKGQVKSLKSVEQEAIRFALQHSGGCMMRAAKSLGIGRSTLYRKVGELQLAGYISRANHTTRPMMKVSSTDLS